MNNNTPPTALSGQWIHLTMQDYADPAVAKPVPASGIQVSGTLTDASEAASAFIGLDQNTAVRRFRELVLEAAQNAKK